MSDYLFEGLTVAVRQTDDYAQYGVVIHGVFFPFGGDKIGGFLSDVAEARADEAKQQAQQAQQQQQQPPQA